MRTKLTKRLNALVLSACLALVIMPALASAQEASEVTPLTASLDGTKVTVDNLMAGDLESEIQSLAISPAEITSLTIVGEMNTADLDYIWKGAEYGNPVTGALPGLLELDVSGALYADDNALPHYQFSQHPTLQSVALPQNLTTTGEEVFSHTPLESVTFPAGLTSLGYAAFYGCTQLASIDLSACTGLTTIEGDAFYGCEALSSVKLPESLTSIHAYAFQDCKALTDINFPADLDLVSIGAYAFQSTNLASIDLSACTGLTALYEYTFYECPALTSVQLPASLESIESYAFLDCAALEEVTFLRETAPTVGPEAFLGVPAVGTLYYPAGATGYEVADGFASPELDGWRRMVSGLVAPTVTNPVPQTGDNNTALLLTVLLAAVSSALCTLAWRKLHG